MSEHDETVYRTSPGRVGKLMIRTIFFMYYFANDTDKNTITIANNLSSIIILQGPLFINNLVKLECSGNIVSIKSKFKNRSEMFGYILEHIVCYNFKLRKYQIGLAI